MTNHCTLQQLQLEIKQVLANGITQRRWVTAEISEMNTNYSGHCYLELIERKQTGNDVLAKMRATIWASNYRLLKAYFETSTKMELQRGLKVLICATVEYHEVWGMSLNITDIDPVYTLGEQARRRQEIIAQLEADGVIDMNKQIDLPMVIQRVAVISSATAAGYGDFITQLQNNSYGYKIKHTLFTAAMQGKDTEGSVVAAFDEIFSRIDEFDAVALIRGGGSQSDLSSFDSYDIATNIAQFPLPVFTGIGHERDDTVADLVAHTRLKTPTAVADFIIERASMFEAEMISLFEQIAAQVEEKIGLQIVLIQELNSTISASAYEQLHQQERLILQISNKISSRAQRKLASQQKVVMRAIFAMQSAMKRSQLSIQSLEYYDKRVRAASIYALQKKNQQLQHIEGKLLLLDPQRLLERGYTISLTNNGQVIKSVHDVQAGQEITTRLRDGELKSKIV